MEAPKVGGGLGRWKAWSSAKVGCSVETKVESKCSHVVSVEETFETQIRSSLDGDADIGNSTTDGN